MVVRKQPRAPTGYFLATLRVAAPQSVGVKKHKCARGRGLLRRGLELLEGVYLGFEAGGYLLELFGLVGLDLL